MKSSFFVLFVLWLAIASPAKADYPADGPLAPAYFEKAGKVVSCPNFQKTQFKLLFGLDWKEVKPLSTINVPMVRIINQELVQINSNQINTQQAREIVNSPAS